MYVPTPSESRVLLEVTRQGLSLIRANAQGPRGLDRIYQVSTRLAELPKLLAGQMKEDEAHEHLAWLERTEGALLASARRAVGLA